MATEAKPSNLAGSSKGKFDSSIKDKKKLSDLKPRSVSTATVIKTEKGKSQIISSSSKTKTSSTKVNVKREKKVYTLPGQKSDPPEEREPLRIFYESLSQQIPESEMAEFWMMEHGLLSPERARKAHEKKQRKQKQQRLGIPNKSPPPRPPPPRVKPESSQRHQQASKNGDVKTKRPVKYEDDDDDDNDFVLSSKRRKG